jgi:hypothetical protein
MSSNNAHCLLFLGILLSLSQTLVGQEKRPSQKNTIIETFPFELTSHNHISIKAVLGGVDSWGDRAASRCSANNAIEIGALQWDRVGL